MMPRLLMGFDIMTFHETSSCGRSAAAFWVMNGDTPFAAKARR
jgi:hypothetical protein